MSGDTEYGVCSFCKKAGYTTRKYYHFKVKCSCCSGDTHFEIVRHCDKCNPKPPKNVLLSIPSSELEIVNER